MRRPFADFTYSQIAILLVAISAQLVVVMDTSIVGVSLVSIQRAIPFTTAGLSWIFSAYVLTFGGFLLFGGRLSDAIGEVPVFRLGWIVLAVGSVLAGFSDSEASLITGRALQGFGGALISPASLALLRAAFPDENQLQRSLNYYSAAAPVGGTSGVILGGLIDQWLDWRWIFYINVPVAIGVLVVAAVMLRHKTRRGVDFRGLDSALMTVGVGSCAYTLVGLAGAGSDRVMESCMAVLGCVSLAIVVQRQRSARRPLLDLSAEQFAATVRANLLQFTIGAAWMPAWFYLNLYLQSHWGWIPIRAAVSLTPMIIATVFAMTLLVPQATERLGESRTITIGCILLTAAILGFSAAGIFDRYLIGVLLPGFLGSVGMAFAFAPSFGLAVRSSRPDQTGIASALVNTSYQMGSVLGISIVAFGISFTPGKFHEEWAFVISGAIAALGFLGVFLLKQPLASGTPGGS